MGRREAEKRTGQTAARESLREGAKKGRKKDLRMNEWDERKERWAQSEMSMRSAVKSQIKKEHATEKGLSLLSMLRRTRRN